MIDFALVHPAMHDETTNDNLAYRLLSSLSPDELKYDGEVKRQVNTNTHSITMLCYQFNCQPGSGPTILA
jgi:hypothetical protein